MLPLICPEAYSALLRTSMMVAPWAANTLKSADGPMPNSDLNELNILGFVLYDATKVMVVFGVCCDNCHSHYLEGNSFIEQIDLFIVLCIA